MKKLFAIFCIILLVFPFCAFAAKSPTTTNKIYSVPAVKFDVVDNALTVRNLEKVLPQEELEEYLWYELLYVELDKEYETVAWHFPADMSKLEKAKVVIIGETVTLQDAIIEDDSIVVDFTGISPGNYYLCFFLNELV